VPQRTYLQSLELFGMKLGLQQIRSLLGHLGRPDDAFRTIIVAGTNGKGSVTAMVERGLRTAGFRTGRYTSPHLVALEERFVIDGEPIDARTLDALIERVREAAEPLASPPTYFEATTAAAIEGFRDAGVDVAVLEVGLGGRLDATNAVDAVASAITAVDFDHEEHLGHTIEAIAREKAGVVRRGALAVLGENPEPVRDVVQQACRTAGARLVYAPAGVTAEARMADGLVTMTLTTPRDTYGDVALALRGRHQIANAITAVRLLEEVSAHGLFPLSREAIRAAVEDVTWPARLEVVRWHDRDVLLDGAHNPAGARALADYVGEAYGRKLPMVVGVMRDKDIPALLSALAPWASHFVFTAPATPRAATPAELAAAAAAIVPQVPVTVAASPLEALELTARWETPTVVGGSLYLCGEIRAAIA